VPIYKMSEPGVFQLFEPTVFPDLESKLEDWVERNPHLLFPGESVVFIGRQTTTAFGKQLDLLGLDEGGAAIVVELKRGLTPRDVVAQTLEYAAWVDSLELDELDAIARAYALKRQKAATGVLDLYREAFGPHVGEPEETAETTGRLTFNTRQRMVIVAEEFSPELIQTLHYLRTKMGVDIAGLRFTVHRLDDDILIDTETVVGRELRAAAANKAAAPSIPESNDQTRARVLTDFVREQVDAFDNWISKVGGPGAETRLTSGSNRTVYRGGRRLLSYYFAQRWIHFTIPAPTDDERAVARQLGGDKILERQDWMACNVASASELALLRPMLEGAAEHHRGRLDNGPVGPSGNGSANLRAVTPMPASSRLRCTVVRASTMEA